MPNLISVKKSHFYIVTDFISYVYVTVADGHVIMPRVGPKATTNYVAMCKLLFSTLIY